MRLTRVILFVSSFAQVVLALRAVDQSSLREAAQHVREGDMLMQQSRDALDPTRYVPARAAYQHALELDPQHAPAMLGLAWVANSEHLFEEGARWCRAALALDPGLAGAHALLGDGAVELGDYDAAMEHYQRAIDRRPDLASYSRAAHLLWLTGQPVRARAVMQAAIAAGGAYPENVAWCQAQLALMHWEAGELDAAGRVLEEGLHRSPRNAHLLHVTSRVLASRGELEAALEMARRSVAAAPTHDALADLVDLLLVTDQRDEALRQMARVLAYHANQHAHPGGTTQTSDANQPHFHGNAQLALFLAERGQSLEVALGEAEAAVAATPNPGAHEALAWCYHQLGRHADAVEQIKLALRWNTPSARLHFHAGMIFAKAGDKSLAHEHLERALDLNPKFHPRFATQASTALTALGDEGPDTQQE